MTSQFLAAHMVKTTGDSFPAWSFMSSSAAKLYTSSCCLQSGSSRACLPSSSSSVISLQWDSAHGNREIRVSRGSREVRVCCASRETSAFLRSREIRVCHGSRETRLYLGIREAKGFHGRAERKFGHGSRENMVCHGSAAARFFHGSAKARALHERRESRFYHAILPFFLKQTFSLHEKQEHTSTGMRLSPERRNMSVCHCILASFLKKSTFTTEEDEKQRQRSRQYALLSLCAQAMVASHMAQSPVLSFLWKNWPSMLDQLSAGGQGGGNSSKGQVDGTGEPNNASSPSSGWRVLAMGLLLGIVIAMVLTSSLAIGPMLDACLWLCLLWSSLFFMGWATKTVICTLVLISRGGISHLGKSCTRALQEWVDMGLFKGFLVGVIALITSMYFLDRGIKKKARASAFSVMSIWSRLSTKVEGSKVETRRRGRRWQGESKASGFLPNMLPKQTKM